MARLEFDGDEGRDEVLEQPSWQQAKAAIRALDGGLKDSVVLEGSDGSYMGVVGGAEDQYVVAGFLQTSGRFILASGVGIGAVEKIPVCGDENPFCDFEIVELAVVLRVAEVFFYQGVCDPGLKWNEGSAAID